MRKLSFCALAIVAVGCSSEMSGPGAGVDSEAAATQADPNVATASAAQTKAFAALKADTKREWTWLQHEKLATPMHLEAQRGVGAAVLTGREKTPLEIAKVTKAFLGQYKDLFKMRDAEAELDLEHARKVAAQMRAGNVHLNYPPGDTAAPFGGYKQSGNGREYGAWGLEEFLETKAVIGHEAA